MATTATQATGTSPFQGKFGTNTGTSADGLGNAFLSNQPVAPVSVPTIGAPSLGSISGGLNLMPMPTSLGVMPQAVAAPVATNAALPGSGPTSYYTGLNVKSDGTLGYAGKPGNVIGGGSAKDNRNMMFKTNMHGR